MAASKFEGVMINRLLVLLQLSLIPIYFFFFSIRWRDEITVFFNNLTENPFWARLLPEWLIWFEINLGIPIFFSLPWVGFSLLRATRIADSYELMGRALGKVRVDQKLFYGLNAAFTLIFLIFPFLSPLITIIGIIWLIRTLLRKAIIGRLWIVWFIPAILLSAIPGLIAVAFYSNYVALFQTIFSTWKAAIPQLFGIGLSLAIAISLGNFILFLFEGSVKYGGYKEVPYGFVLVFKTFVFLVLMIIYLNSETLTLINVINYVAVFFGIFEMVMRRVRDLPTEDGVGSGIIMVIAFSIVNIIINVLREFTTLTQWIQTIVIVVSGLIFFVLFYLSYSYAEEEFDYGTDKEPAPAKEDNTKTTEEDD